MLLIEFMPRRRVMSNPRLSEHAQSLILAAQSRIVSLANPKLAALPSWVQDLRPQQIQAAERIVDAFQEHDVVVLDAPTGSGKTLIADIVRRMVAARTVYCCSSIQLQRQFTEDFPYAKQLMGRSNYVPVWPKWDETCADCTGEGCELRSEIVTSNVSSPLVEGLECVAEPVGPSRRHSNFIWFSNTVALGTSCSDSDSDISHQLPFK